MLILIYQNLNIIYTLKDYVYAGAKNNPLIGTKPTDCKL